MEPDKEKAVALSFVTRSQYAISGLRQTEKKITVDS
jgi:hypothetical protein